MWLKMYSFCKFYNPVNSDSDIVCCIKASLQVADPDVVGSGFRGNTLSPAFLCLHVFYVAKNVLILQILKSCKF